MKKSEPDLKGKEDSVLRCLAAVRQHSPTLYDATMAGQLPKLAEDLTDVQLRRVIRLFGMDQRCWSWLSRPLQIRLQTIVTAYTYDEDGTRDYLFDGLAISELCPLLLVALGRLDEDEKMTLIARNPRAEFADAAIDIYRSANSWRGAELVGANLILPLAEFLTPAQIERIADAIVENSQIYTAHGTAAQAADVFRRTSRIHASTTTYWEGMVQRLADQRVRFSALEEAMEEAGMTLPRRRAKSPVE